MYINPTLNKDYLLTYLIMQDKKIINMQSLRMIMMYMSIYIVNPLKLITLRSVCSTPGK